MWFRVAFCLCFLAHNIQSEVSQGNPVEQDIRESNENRMEYLKNLTEEYENLTIALFHAPNVRQGEDTLKLMCEQNGGNGTYEEAQKALKSVKKCFADIVSYAELPAKIKKSKPYGELDTVFKEYCLKTDEIKLCLRRLVYDIDPCLVDYVRDSKNTLERATESLLNFICENEGDHIALFISEKGPDCILSKQEGIKKCVQDHSNDNKTNPTLWPEYINDGFNATKHEKALDNREFDLAQCRWTHKVRKCIVNELTTCSGSTPANVVDSIFNLIHNTTRCAKYKMEEIDPDYSSGTSLFTSMFSVIIPALTVLLVRTFSS